MKGFLLAAAMQPHALPFTPACNSGDPAQNEDLRIHGIYCDASGCSDFLDFYHCVKLHFKCLIIVIIINNLNYCNVHVLVGSTSQKLCAS